METKDYNKKLMAMRAIKNLGNAFEKNYAQLLEIEKDLVKLNEHALSVIQTHASAEVYNRFDNMVKEINSALSSMSLLLGRMRERTKGKGESGDVDLWKLYEDELKSLQVMYNIFEQKGYEVLPPELHKHWKKDVVNFEAVTLPIILSHAEACRAELKLIESYTPAQLDKMTQIILEHIPDDFTFDEAGKYEKEYLKAFEELKKEFRKKKNLWDRFLDILAGGTHQPASERIMLQRWIDGDKKDL